MSYGSELWAGMMIEQALEDNLIDSLLTNKQWQIRSGKVLNVKDMKTSHIQNCINKIVKSDYQWRGIFYKMLNNELESRENK